MSITQLPIIDLAELERGPQAKAAFLDKLRQVTHEVGFFYLTGHGFPDNLAQDLLSSAREFFALPTKVKQQIDITNSPHFRGYTPIGEEHTQGIVDWREQLDIGADHHQATDTDINQPWNVLYGANQWPAQVPKLRELSLSYLEYANRTGRKLISAWAQSLGQATDVFDDAFDNAFPTFKIVHYPAHDGSITAQGVGNHRDVGALTLLYIEPGSTGLQVEYKGKWIDADPIPNHFVVNIGELLEVATSGYLKATPHRVLATKPGENRFSLPFFLNPALDKALPKLVLPEELAKQAVGVGQDSAGNKLHATYGLNALKSRFRAHPSVTKRHHIELANYFAQHINDSSQNYY